MRTALERSKASSRAALMPCPRKGSAPCDASPIRTTGGNPAVSAPICPLLPSLPFEFPPLTPSLRPPSFLPRPLRSVSLSSPGERGGAIQGTKTDQREPGRRRITFSPCPLSTRTSAPSTLFLRSGYLSFFSLSSPSASSIVCADHEDIESNAWADGGGR